MIIKMIKHQLFHRLISSLWSRAAWSIEINKV